MRQIDKTKKEVKMNDQNNYDRETTANGEGLLSTNNRGRWPIQPGDRVLLIDTEFAGLYKECIAGEVEPEGFVFLKSDWYHTDGRHDERQRFPKALRLYPGEKVPATTAEALMFLAKEMVAEQWDARYGKTKK